MIFIIQASLRLYIFIKKYSKFVVPLKDIVYIGILFVTFTSVFMKNQTIRLKKGKEAIFKNRHLWLFSGAVESWPDDFINGSIQKIESFEGECLGYGYFHRGLSLAGRILSFGQDDPYKTIQENIKKAIVLRRTFFNKQQTNAYRLINGEGDFLPGLIVDKYNECLVLQSYTLGMDHLKSFIVECLVKEDQYNSIFEKSVSSVRKEERLQEQVGMLYGEDKEGTTILENGLKFLVNWKTGQKTGFFLDQREMRALVGKLSYQKRVLNCFSYTGGFSIYALAGGAKQVDSLDISATATHLAQENLLLNNFDPQIHHCIKEDVFDFLTTKPLPYELIILDPPAFAKKKRDIPQAVKGYRKINSLAFAKAPEKSLVLTCSCSYYLDEQMFQEILFQAAREARREIKILAKHIQGMDHPVNIFHPESHYLKSFLLYIE